MGYSADIGPNAYAGEGVGISSTPEKCAAELEDYYANHGDALISIGGGELMCETIGKLDLDKIAGAKPKWYLGYSDNTNFGFMLPTMFDTVSLYGPCAPAFGMKELHQSLTDCFDILTGESMISHGYDMWELNSCKENDNPFVPYNLTEETHLKFFRWNGEPLEGRFVGGCLDVLSVLCGTRFDNVKAFNEKYQKDGVIWFLEACDLSAMCIRRSLWQLRNAGWFDCAKAFLFGRPLRITDEADFCGVDEYNAAEAVLGDMKVPIIMDADIGHLPPAMTMMNGGYGVLSTYGKDNIQILWRTKE